MKAFNLLVDMWVYALSEAGVLRECLSLCDRIEAVREVVTDHLRYMDILFSVIENYQNPDAEWDGDYCGV
jgi:hypothetical protein